MARRDDEHIRQLVGVLNAGVLNDVQKRSLIRGMVALRKSLREHHPQLDAHGHQDSPDGELGEPTSVYKYFDARRILIYVGITNAGILRNRQHNHSKEWWQYVVSQEIEHFSSRRLAHQREVELIEKFRPPFNTQHNRDHAASRRFYLNMVKGVVSLPVEVLHDRKSLTSKSA